MLYIIIYIYLKIQCENRGRESQLLRQVAGFVSIILAMSVSSLIPSTWSGHLEAPRSARFEGMRQRDPTLQIPRPSEPPHPATGCGRSNIHLTKKALKCLKQVFKGPTAKWPSGSRPSSVWSPCPPCHHPRSSRPRAFAAGRTSPQPLKADHIAPGLNLYIDTGQLSGMSQDMPHKLVCT